jgi:hypothetical protein
MESDSRASMRMTAKQPTVRFMASVRRGRSPLVEAPSDAGDSTHCLIYDLAPFRGMLHLSGTSGAQKWAPRQRQPISELPLTAREADLIRFSNRSLTGQTLCLRFVRRRLGA